jgi:hypothetical protein
MSAMLDATQEDASPSVTAGRSLGGTPRALKYFSGTALCTSCETPGRQKVVDPTPAMRTLLRLPFDRPRHRRVVAAIAKLEAQASADAMEWAERKDGVNEKAERLSTIYFDIVEAGNQVKREVLCLHRL